MKKQALLLTLLLLTSRFASAEGGSLWCAIQVRGEVRECLTSMDLKTEIAARTLDDKTLEYLNAVSKTDEEYARLRGRILERAWVPGLQAIARERIWETAGKELNLSITKKHFKEALRARTEGDERLGVAAIRRILGREVGAGATDAEVLRHRRTQQHDRVMTELRAGFARAVQDTLYSRHASSIIAPRLIKLRYDELKSRSASQVHWQGFASKWMTPQEANTFATRLHAILGTQGQRRQENGQTWWDLPSAEMGSTRDLSPISTTELPEAWSTLKPDSMGSPRALIAATEGPDSRVRLELWVASRVVIPEWQEASPVIERSLRSEERQAILEKHFVRAASQIGLVLAVDPTHEVRGNELVQQLSNF